MPYGIKDEIYKIMLLLQHKFFANQAVVCWYVGVRNFWFSLLEIRIENIRNHERLGFLGVNSGS
jgi:hypothetical protein